MEECLSITPLSTARKSHRDRGNRPAKSSQKTICQECIENIKGPLRYAAPCLLGESTRSNVRGWSIKGPQPFFHRRAGELGKARLAMYFSRVPRCAPPRNA